MVYSTEIIGDVFDKTKKLFFPINLKYWLKMGFVGLFTGSGTGSGGGNGYSSSRSGGESPFKDMTFREVVSKGNQVGLDFFQNYGYLVGIGLFVLYGLGLFFSYLSSVFTFVFFEGLFDKKFTIKNSFSKSKKLGTSLFAFRFIFGIINLVITLLIFSPLIMSFISNDLINFNLWLLIPMFLILIIISFIISIFLFLINDFVIPIMFTKKYAFGPSWDYFKKIAVNKKMEIFLYWLVKLGLGFASGVISFITIIPVLLIIGLIMIPVVIVAILLYLLFNLISQYVAIGAVVLFGFIVMLVLVYLLVTVFIPIPAFFRLYSVEMLKKLEKGN